MSADLEGGGLCGEAAAPPSCPGAAALLLFRLVTNVLIETIHLNQLYLNSLYQSGRLMQTVYGIKPPVPIDRIDGVPAYRCTRCGYRWFPRNLSPENLNDIGEPPPKCANRKCQSPYWNRERKNKVAAKKRAAKKQVRQPHAT